MGKRILTTVVILVIAAAAWAQDQGDGRGERPVDPEMLREQVMLEVQVWHKFLELSDEQLERVVELIIENRNEMIEVFRSGGGGRPDPSVIEEMSLKKALAIFEVLSDEQKGAMNYYYNDIISEITESLRSRFQAGGVDGRGGERPQAP